MRNQFPSKKNKGFALLFTCLGAAVVVSIALASYLTLVENQYADIGRSQAWNSSMVIAESGVEEGMSLINKYAGTGNFITGWPSTATTDGWAKSGNVYSLTRSIGAGSYTVYVTNVSSTVAAIYARGTDNWTNQSITALQRAVLVNAAISSLFQGAILAKNGITLNGGSTYVDSFNSADTNYSSNGQYVLSKREAGGNIMTDASNATMTTEITLTGGARVYGKAYTGPNDGISVSGAIGDTNFAGPGIESGWSNSTMNISVPDAPPIPSGVSWLPLPTEVNNTYVLSGLGPGTTNYYMIPSTFNNLGGGNAILVTNGTIVLVAQANNFQISGSATVTVAPNANMQFFLNGSSPTISGVVNQTGNATNVAIYGTPNCTSITFSGASAFIGTVYAPEAAITYSGSAAFVGAAVANSFNDSGGAAIHFDQALLGQASGAYVVSTWQEVSP